MKKIGNSGSNQQGLVPYSPKASGAGKGKKGEGKMMLTRKNVIAGTSAILVAALLVTTFLGFMPGLGGGVLRAHAETADVLTSLSGKNSIPELYSAANFPAGSLPSGVTDRDGNGLAVFDFHIFAENFASTAHTCGNIAVENLGGSVLGGSGAPEFGSRANHDTIETKVSYINHVKDWGKTENYDALVLGAGNELFLRNGMETLFKNEDGKQFTINNQKKYADVTYQDNSTPYIDIKQELKEAESYQAYLVKLMDDEIEKCGVDGFYPGWGYCYPGDSVRVLRYEDIAGGWFGPDFDFSKYPEDTIIIDLGKGTEPGNFWNGWKSTEINEALKLIAGSVKLKGDSGKRIIFNIDTTGYDKMAFADTNMQSDKLTNAEGSVSNDNNILWNFYERDGSTIKSSDSTISVGGTWMGTILAPNAGVNCRAGLNGSIIAKNVTTSAETHKSDYTGDKEVAQYINITVKKNWIDNFATRPATLTVRLLQNGKVYKTVQMTGEGDTWTTEFKNLPAKDSSGKIYRYTVEETVPAGYTGKVVNYTLTNTSEGGKEAPKTASLTLKKVEKGTTTGIAGAQFKLTSDQNLNLSGAKGEGISNFVATDNQVTWTSSKNGDTITNLPQGKYTITEINAPAGYKVSPDKKIDLNSTTKSENFEDEVIKAKFSKLEAANKDFLPGATLKLTSNSGVDLSGITITGGNDIDKENNSTSAQRTWVSKTGSVEFSKIPVGSYTITETAAPTGYDVAAPVTFTVEKDGRVLVNNQQVGSKGVEMLDTVKKNVEEYGNLTIRKTDGTNLVPGAAFQLVNMAGKNMGFDNGGSASINGADNAVLVGTGDTLNFETTDSEITITHIPAGSYQLTETSAPAGYKKAGSVGFTVKGDETSTVNNGPIEVVNEAISASISKKDLGSGKELAGADLELTSTASLAGVKVDGVTPSTATAEKIAWRSTGSPITLSKLPAGTYILSEANAPAGYKKAGDVTFTVDEYGNITGSGVSGNTVTMYDEPTVVKVTKKYDFVDASSTRQTGVLPGATLRLDSTDGIDLSNVTGTLETTHLSATAISWKSGLVENQLRGLPDGVYTLTETEVPEGFTKSEPITLTVSNNGAAVTAVYKDNTSTSVMDDGTVTVIDGKEQFHSMVFTKIDADKYLDETNSTVELVPGAKLGIFKEGTSSYTPENAIMVFDSATTATEVMLADGDYVLAEIAAPDGYERTDDKIYFTVENGTPTVKKIDASELAVAEFGNPSDEGLAEESTDCYYTLEATQIFAQYGYLPDNVTISPDDGKNYKLDEFTLYKGDKNANPPTKEIVATLAKTDTAESSWNATIPSTEEYDPDLIYYAVVRLSDENGPLTPDKTPNINLRFSYVSTGGKEVISQGVGSTDGFKLNDCTNYQLSLNAAQIASSGFPTVSIVAGDDCPDTAWWNNAQMDIYVVLDNNDSNPQHVKCIRPISGTYGNNSFLCKKGDLQFSGDDIAGAIASSSYNNNPRVTGYTIKMNQMDVQGASGHNFHVDVVADYGGGSGVDANIDVGATFETVQTELGGNKGAANDPIGAAIFSTYEGGATAYVVLPNYKTPEKYDHVCAVEVTKQDEAGNAITDNPASFLLYDNDGNLIDDLYATADGAYKYVKPGDDTTGLTKVNYKTTKDVIAGDGSTLKVPDYVYLRTDNNGKLSVTKLNDGQYNLKECIAPKDYEISEENTHFTLTLSNLEGDSALKVKVKDEKLTGELLLIKNDDAGNLKQGATFELHRIDLKTGVLDTGFNEEYTTGNDGKCSVTGLDLGYLYYAVETGAAPGTVNSNENVKLPQLTGMKYVINGIDYTYGIALGENIANLQEATQEGGWKAVDATTNMMGNITAVNASTKTTVKKTDGTNALAGATLCISLDQHYSVPQLADVRAYVVDGTTLTPVAITYDCVKDGDYYKESITWQSTNDAQGVTFYGLPADTATDTYTYTVSEIEAPDGYAEAANVTGVKAGDTETLVDNVLTGSVTLTKREDGNYVNRLDGAKFKLQISDNETDGWTDYSSTEYTTANGQIKVEGLPYGKYYRFVETKAPTGYDMPADPNTDAVRVTKSELDCTIDAYNTKQNGSVTLLKTGANDAALPGATFALLYSETENGTYALCTDGNVVNGTVYNNGTRDCPGYYTTDADGEITVDGLKWGWYKFEEFEAPEGYDKAEEPTAAQQLSSGTSSAIFEAENELITATVTLTKVDSADNSVKLKGAQFKLQKSEDGSEWTDVETLTTDENGKIEKTGLDCGYYYRFVETKAPTGYTLPTGDNAITQSKQLTTTLRSFEVTFGNAKQSSSVAIPAMKTIDGRNIKTDDKFSFTLTEVDEDGEVLSGGKTQTKENSGNTISFDAISYNLTGTSPEYHYYKITENAIDPAIPGVTKDDSVFIVKVKVSIDADNKLSAVIEEVTKDGTALDGTKGMDSDNKPLVTFVNEYAPASVKHTVKVTKTLTGRDMAADEFEFVLREKGSDGKFTDVETIKNTASTAGTPKELSFAEIEYTEAGTHVYTVEEVKGTLGGITYSTAKYTFSVVVEDDGNGQLTACEVLPENITKLEFENAYGTVGTTATVDGNKKLNGIASPAKFTFEMYESDKDGVIAQSAEPVKTATSSTETGKVGTFSITTPTINDTDTHYYVIKEKTDSLADGITADGKQYLLTVKAKDEGTGALKIDTQTLEILGTDGAKTEVTSADFANTSKADAVITGTKLLDGEPSAKEFTFELYLTDSDYVIADGAKPDYTTKNDTNGKFTFTIKDISVTEKTTYYYVIKEQIPEGATADGVKDGIKYSKAVAKGTFDANLNPSNGAIVLPESIGSNIEFKNSSFATDVKVSKVAANGGKELAGATIEIAPVGDGAKLVCGELPDCAAKVGDKITWVSTGETVEIKGLGTGVYTMTEKVAPGGYDTAEVIYFKVADDGSVYSAKKTEFEADGFSWDKLTALTGNKVIMEDAPYTATFSKKAAADDSNELEGAVLSITPVNSTTKLDNVQLNGAELKDGAITWTSGAEAKTIGALPNGVYEFKEITAPNGYEVAEVIYVKIDGADVYSMTKAEYDAETDWATKTPSNKAVMLDAPTQIFISKQEVGGGSELEGAHLIVKDKDNATVAEWTSTSEKKTIDMIPAGEYTLTEITSPSGYEVTETMTFKVMPDGSVQVKDGEEFKPVTDKTIVMFDAPNSFTFSKQAAGGGDELPGAVICIKPVDEETDLTKVKLNKAKLENGVITWTSGEEAETIGSLPDGVYEFTEITSPSGYEVAETIYFKIASGSVYCVPKADYDEEDTEWGEAADKDTVIMFDAPNKVVLSKQAAGAGTELEGAQLTFSPVISDADMSGIVLGKGAALDKKTNVISWKSTKDAVTLGMVPDGVYKFTEITAPNGYDKAETIYIKVESGSVYNVKASDFKGEATVWGSAVNNDTVTMIDMPKSAPQKGSFSFVKYSDIGLTVSGAKFQLVGSNGYEATATSDSTGTVAFAGLKPALYTLSETEAPKNFTKTSNIAYVLVDDEGKVTFKNEKNEVITADQLKVLMTNNIVPPEVPKDLKVGDEIDLEAEVLAAHKEYENLPITWSSSDPSIATVDENGKVKILKPGKVTILAKSGDVVLESFVLGATETQSTGSDDTPATGDVDKTPTTGEDILKFTVIAVSVLAVAAVVLIISGRAIKKSSEKKENGGDKTDK